MAAGRKVRAPFEAPDADGDFPGLVAYLDNLRALPVIAEIKDWIASSVAASAPRVIGEIGCGNGDMSARLAHLCPDARHVLGFDFSERFIDVAHGRHGRAHPGLFYVVAEAGRIPCASGSFDSIVIERVLMHIETPFDVISEAARLLSSGRDLVVCETDWQSLRIDHPDTSLTSEILSAYTGTMKSPHIGRELEALVLKAGFDVSEARIFSADIQAEDADILLKFTRLKGFALSHGIPEDDIDRWIADIRRTGVLTHISFKGLKCRKRPYRRAA